jgi:ubiquinone/menaquinone biosynthesis C-methylase UbiE
MKTTREFFDSCADNWDKINTYEASHKAFDKLVALLNIADGSSVVDLGCGTGVLMPHLLEAAGSSGTIYAVDISEKMIANLRKKFEANNIVPLVCSSTNLGIVNNAIDTVICFSAFPHFDNKRKSIEEISRILKPGGRFLIAHFSSREEINAFHSKLEPPLCHHHLPGADELSDLLNKNGFSIKRYIDEKGRYELLAVITKEFISHYTSDCGLWPATASDFAKNSST